MNLHLKDRTTQRRWWSLTAALLVLSGFLTAPAIVTAGGLDDPQTESGDAGAALQTCFAELESAWQTGDQHVLADRVHSDGVRVRFEGSRQAVYSPSQAFYYFKNLFHGRRTLDFRFVRTQDPSAGDLIHGLAVWEFILDGDGQAQEVKLDFVLIQEKDTWRLTRLDTIR